VHGQLDFSVRKRVRLRQEFSHQIGEKNNACAQYVPQGILKRTERKQTIPKTSEGAALRSSKLLVTILKDSKPVQNAARWSHSPASSIPLAIDRVLH